MGVVSEASSDILFHCDNRMIALALARANAAPWMYTFQRHLKCVYVDQAGWMPMPGAAHGDEIVYVFNNAEWLASNPPNATIPTNTSCKPALGDLKLGDRMSRLWGGFARTGHMEDSWGRFLVGEEKALWID